MMYQLSHHYAQPGKLLFTLKQALLEICPEEATPSTVDKPTGWHPPYRSGRIVIYGHWAYVIR